MREVRSTGSIGTTVAIVAGALIGVLVVAAGAVIVADKFGEDPDEHTQQFIDDLSLSVQPRPAERGEVVTFFVQGEPPTSLRAHRYADLLSADGDKLYRLDSNETSTPAKPIAYPLPPDYAAPPGLVRLQTRQAIRLPAHLPPGRYTLQTEITGVGHGRGYSGTPSSILPIVVSSERR